MYGDGQNFWQPFQQAYLPVYPKPVPQNNSREWEWLKIGMTTIASESDNFVALA